MQQYNPTNLFQVGIDTIKYLHQNQVEHTFYNTVQRKGELVIKKEVPYISFPVLEQLSYIKHGFSTRLGGVSTNFFSTMNLSFTRGDTKELVLENYNRICAAIGVTTDSLVYSDQIHSTNIQIVTSAHCNKKALHEIDGLITNEKNITLVTFYADCVPLYFVDTVQKVIGLSHSGWRGTANKIGQKTVEAMQAQFSSNPKDILAVIGPSICRNCYEISEEVYVEFERNFTQIQMKTIFEKKENKKYQCDLWLANKYILEQAGILPEHISISEICSACNSNLLYSHRISNGQRGNLAAFLTLV